MSPSPTATSTPFRRTPRPSGAIRSRDRGDGAAAAATAELTAAAAAETATTTTAVMEPVTSATPGAATEPATTTEPAATATPGATSVSGDSGKADPKKPMIALTFDDGPSKYTAKVLDALNKSGGRATFCMVGNRIGDNAKTAKLVAEQGSEVIGHSWDHKQLTKLSAAAIKAELVKTNDAIEAATGSRSKLYRPPYGSVNDSVKKISKELGLSMINWSVDTLDWKSRNADTVYKNIMADAKDGSIVLCHDLYESTLKAVERAIPA
ncbi:MAG: polysaccharide deacetylase family protein, partial [Clostridiales bacterium]|nr:polysaccharide deacetylase family protein [Clostridiales bacterium]